MELFGNSTPTFPSQKIRIIPYSEYPGELNMAIDYYFSNNVVSNNEPILRFYGWKPYCLSLGKHQDVNQIDFHKLARDGFDIVRRPTGGSAIFHSEELTYSIITPKSLIDHKELYLLMHLIIYTTLLKMGYKVSLRAQNESINYLKNGDATFVCFNRSAYTEIQYDKKKLVGSAQKIYTDSILQHGSILIGPAQNKIVDYFKYNNQVRSRTLRHLSEHSTCLIKINEKQVKALDVSENIIADISQSTEINYKPISIQEIDAAKKYCSDFGLKKLN